MTTTPPQPPAVAAFIAATGDLAKYFIETLPPGDQAIFVDALDHGKAELTFSIRVMPTVRVSAVVAATGPRGRRVFPVAGWDENGPVEPAKPRRFGRHYHG